MSEQQYLNKIGDLEALVESLYKRLEDKEYELQVVKGYGLDDEGFYEMIEVKSSLAKNIQLYQKVYYDDGK
jgi:hypothetical protein